jgi:damage-control phosphatase, subfamily I
VKTYLDCIPCFYKQALDAARKAGADEETQKKILNEVATVLSNISLRASPPEIGRHVYALVREFSGTKDPYLREKSRSNELALASYGRLKRRMSSSGDRLLLAVELAIAGNIIDYGVKNTLDVDSELDRIINEEDEIIKKERKSVFDYSGFKRVLKKTKDILYLADNAGEVVFDRILIEEIKRMDKDKKITYAVKEKPVINDALAEDAVFCGIGDIADIVSSGSDAPGTVLSFCSDEFLGMYKKAGMVISKGQGNFEALSGAVRPVFFLFMAKCPVIAGDIGCKMGDVILKYHMGKR